MSIQFRSLRIFCLFQALIVRAFSGILSSAPPGFLPGTGRLHLWFKGGLAMFFPFFDPTYMLLFPAIILALYAQMKVSSTFQRYLRVGASSGLTGAQVARDLLNKNNLSDIAVEITRAI